MQTTYLKDVECLLRWFKSLNVTIASERQQRSLAKGIVGDNLKAERAPFSFSTDRNKEEIREIPFVYRPNLIAAIADIVAQHERYKIGMCCHVKVRFPTLGLVMA